jgi:hypothetical protein
VAGDEYDPEDLKATIENPAEQSEQDTSKMWRAV